MEPHPNSNIRFFTAALSVPLLASVALTGCGYRRKADVYSQVATVTPHYSSIRAGIIQPKCASCHGPGGEEGDFTTYSGAARHVRPGRPDSSSFYTQVESGDMPVGRPMLSDDELLAIYQWIQNGAPND